MKQTILKLMMMVLTVTATVSLTACGGDDDEPATTPTTPTTPTTTMWTATAIPESACIPT